MGDGRRKGGKRDLYDGGKRERSSKRQAFVICYCLHPIKETNPTTFWWLPSNVLRGLKQKSRKTKIRSQGKKKKQHYSLWNWKPSRVAYIIGHEWDGHMYTSRSSQSIKIGFELSIDKSIEMEKRIWLISIGIDQSVEIDDTLVSFIDLSWFLPISSIYIGV